MLNRISCFLMGIVLLVSSSVWANPIFPGAEGAGTDTRAAYAGATNPQIIRVTNLNTYGPGSFYDAVTTSGPRVVIFEVSGVIQLDGNLYITHPYLTIAGQTAPSPGITLTNGGLSIAASNVLVKHIRIARGDKTDVGDALVIWGDRYNPTGETRNVVIDHCSFRWGTDQTVSLWSNNIYDVTISNCIIAEGLDDSIHGEPHSTGLLIGPKAHNIDLIRNYLAHFMGRAPCISEEDEVLMVNNIVYNLGYKGIYTQPKQPDSPASARGPYLSAINNLSLKGLNTRNDYPHVWVQGGTAAGTKIFLSGNSYNGTIPQNQWDNNYTQIDVGFDPTTNISPVSKAGVTVLPTSEVKEYIYANVGARPNDRDANDIRNINNLKDGTGVIIDKPEDVGGLPALAQNYRALTVPANPHDDDDNDGYTNLEEWLFGFSAALEGPRLTNPTIITEKSIYKDTDSVINVTVENIAHNELNWVAIFKKGMEYKSSNVYAWSYVEDSDTISLDGSFNVGDYKIVAFANDTYNVIAENEFEVAEYIAPAISTEKDVYSPSENTVKVNIAGIAHNSQNWIAIFKDGATHESKNIYAWSYIEDSDTIVLNGTFDTGDYKVVAFANDTYDVIVENNFSVQVTQPNTYTVTFIEGQNGIKTGGGDLVQIINEGDSAVSPIITANLGWEFTGWDKSFSNVNSNLTVTANYELKNYTLIYEAEVNGTISGDSPQSVQYGQSGTEVTAVADYGYHFAGWSDGVTDETRVDSNVSSNLNVVASFAINNYTVTFVEGEHGSRTGGGELNQTISYDNDAVEPVITADSGWRFIGWDKSFANIENNLTITAQYTEIKYSLTVNSGSGDGSYSAGTVVTIVADAPVNNYEFDKWVGATVADANLSTTTLEMPAGAVTVSATYKKVMSVKTEKEIYFTNESIIVAQVTNIAHNELNWLAIYKKSTPSTEYRDSKKIYTWAYVKDSDNVSLSGSFGAGEYKVVAFANDGFGVTAESEFLVKTATYNVTFSVGENGVRTGGGELIQIINEGDSAVAPVVAANSGWEFIGWDKSFSDITNDLTVTAIYEKLISIKMEKEIYSTNDSVVVAQVSNIAHNELNWLAIYKKSTPSTEYRDSKKIYTWAYVKDSDNVALSSSFDATLSESLK